ncbi:MAG: aminotransferase class V-fold PLP-dependent enzyme [Ardenticatenaceae bacterium]
MKNEIDVKRARTETPGCENVLHFNNAGASLMPQSVLEAQVGYLELEAAIGGYEAAAQEEEKIEGVYESAARLINAKPDEIAMVENATVAWQLAFASMAWQENDRILTAEASYASNYLNFLLARERYGVQIEVIPSDEYGQVSVDALRERMATGKPVKLIALTHIPTNGGLVNPAAAVGQIAREWDVLYLLDACQSVGQLPVDVETIGCDLLSTTGRKWLRGPRGTGFLYVRRKRLNDLIPPVIDLHTATWTSRDSYQLRDDARRFENWETNYAAKVGLGVAMEYALEWGMDAMWQRIAMLGAQLRTQLNHIPRVTTHDSGQVQGGIVTFSVAGSDATAIQHELAAYQINTSTSSPQSTLLDAQTRQLPTMIRASVHYYNTQTEINRFCDVLHTIVTGK